MRKSCEKAPFNIHNHWTSRPVLTNGKRLGDCKRCILYNSYTSSTKSRSPVSPTVTYGESSDSETGVEVRRSWSTTSEHSQPEHSPRMSKKPSSAGSFRKTRPQRIKRTASMDSTEFLRSVPSASDGKGLSEKVEAY